MLWCVDAVLHCAVIGLDWIGSDLMCCNTINSAIHNMALAYWSCGILQ